MKKLLTIGLTAVLAVGMCLGFVACSKDDEQYQVSKEEYESAFTVESLQNVTISMTGPYWERDHIKSYFYSVGKNFALCSYSEDTQYYGRHYGFANGEEFAYVYGNERLEDFTEEQAVWTKVDNPSYYKTKGVNFVFHYRRDFHLLEYNSKTKSYDYEITASGEKGRYSYFFNNKKLTKFVITNEADDYKYVWNFYDYGMTKIPEEIDKSTPEEPSLPLKCIISQIPYEKGEETYQKYFTTDEYYIADVYEKMVAFHKDVFTDGKGNYIADLPYEEKDFENFVILCYYRCVSGSWNFLPKEYAYIYSTNEIVGKTTYQPPENTEDPAVVMTYGIDFVKVPRDIFEGLKDEYNKAIISISAEIESQFDLTEEKIWWNSDTNADFTDDKILICFKKTTTYPELSIEDFNYENAESIRYIALRPTGGKYENSENYRQIAVINLKEKGRDRVIEAVLYFERISIILAAEPNYIYSIEED